MYHVKGIIDTTLPFKLEDTNDLITTHVGLALLGDLQLDWDFRPWRRRAVERNTVETNMFFRLMLNRKGESL